MREQQMPMIWSRKVYNALAEQYGFDPLPEPKPPTPEELELRRRIQEGIKKAFNKERQRSNK